MSTTDRPIDFYPPSGFKELDLGLKLPADLRLDDLFPQDRLLRLHPLWFVDDFQQQDNRFSAHIKNHATEEKFQLQGTLIYPKTGSILLDIELQQGLNRKIRFIEKNSILKVLLDTKNGGGKEDDPLLVWLLSIREYIRIYLKTSVSTLFFRFLLNRMVLQMNPSQRKICMMIAKITVVELLVIVLIVVGYVLFNQ